MVMMLGWLRRRRRNTRLNELMSASPIPTSPIDQRILNGLIEDGYLSFKSFILTESVYVDISQFIAFAEHQTSRIRFENCHFTQGVIVRGKNAFANLEFENCEVNGSIRFEGLDIGDVHLHNCSIQHESVITNSEIDSIRFFESRCSSDLKVRSSNIGALYMSSYENRKFNGLLIGESNQIKSLVTYGYEMSMGIRFSSIPDRVWIGHGHYEAIVFDSPQALKSFSISSKDRNTELRFKPLIIKRLGMSNLSLQDELKIENAQIKELDISSIRTRQEGNALLNNVTIGHQLAAEEADLSGFTLNNVQFPEDNVFMENAILNDIKLSSINWPTGKNLRCSRYGYTMSMEAQRLSLQKEIYRQLKQANFSQGNRVEGLGFYRNEMETLKALFQLDRSVLSRENRWLVRIDGAASDFGQSWLRPIGLLFSFHIILFSLAVVTGDLGIHIDFWSDFNKDQLSKAYGLFWKFLLPTHKVTTTLGFWSGLLDLLMRLSSGFFIYHIIKASRRYSHK